MQTNRPSLFDLVPAPAPAPIMRAVVAPAATAPAATAPAVAVYAPATHTIADRVVLVDLTIRKWLGVTTDRVATRETNDRAGATAQAGVYRKRLFRKESAMEEAKRIAQEASDYHRYHTAPWDDVRRALLAANLSRHLQVLRQYQDRFEALKPRIEAEYEQEKLEAARFQGSLFNAADYPPVDQILQKYHFTWKVERVPTDDFRVVTELDPALVAELEERARAAERASVQRAAEDVLKRVQELMERVRDNLAEFGTIPAGAKKARTFHSSMVTAIDELVEVIPALNFAGHPGIAQVAETMRQRLAGLDEDHLKTSAPARAEATRAAEAVLAQAAVIQEQMGAFF